MDRRQFLIGSGVLGGLIALPGCGRLVRRLHTAGQPLPDLAIIPTEPEIARLNTIGFGPNRRELESLRGLGWEAFVERQLSADQPIDAALEAQLRSLDIYHLSSAEMADLGEREALAQIQQASILQAVYSPNQLLERMVDFWSNHFSIYAPKVYGAYRKPQDENEVIRKHALGKFPELLRASSTSPAMLAYLDNTGNRNGVPNENYARELLELHTLGVDGGYTQTDVREVARCFTGWTVEDRFLKARGRFRFDPERHDQGEKTVLGVRIPSNGGKQDGARVLEIVSQHPSTHQHLARKICRHFLGDHGAGLVAEAAGVLKKSGGDIKEVLRLILLDPSSGLGSKVLKLPFDHIVSALRLVEAETDGGKGIQRHLDAMGQPLHQWPMPDGYPTKPEAWSGSLLPRWNFAMDLALNRIPGTTVDLRRFVADRSNIEELAMGQDLAEIIVEGTKEALALSLMSPKFVWR